eukprot:scaffold244370_cov35-Attheya_sp.AAC.1
MDVYPSPISLEAVGLEREDSKGKAQSFEKMSPRFSSKTRSAESDDRFSLRNKGLKHSVLFHSVEVREYERSLSDNPAVLDGVPIGLDWDYIVNGSMKFDAYEESQPPRRDHLEFQIPAHARARMMQEEWGHSYSEVLKVYQPRGFTAPTKSKHHSSPW